MPTINVPNGLLNFVIAGEVRSGAAAVAALVNSRSNAVCHASLFHADATIRKNAHESYFGKKDYGPDELPPWYSAGQVNPWQYLNSTVFDHPLREESAVGVHLTYDVLRSLDLYDLIETRCREGDFCVIHVVRNPVACLVSYKQAEKSGIWTSRDLTAPTRVPLAVRIEPDELVAFCRTSLADRAKLRAACDDTYEIPYAHVLYEFRETALETFDFLELGAGYRAPLPALTRLPNRPISQRISNYATLVKAVPRDVQALLVAEDCV